MAGNPDPITVRVKVHIPKTNPIHDEFTGREGILVAMNNKTADVRIELYSHSYKYPSTAILTVPWGHLEILS